ncbi:MAG: hypothetical protein ABR946_02145 [Solirubrobacteraceae bacterium]|jgi:hypothetical protein
MTGGRKQTSKDRNEPRYLGVRDRRHSWKRHDRRRVRGGPGEGGGVPRAWRTILNVRASPRQLPLAAGSRYESQQIRLQPSATLAALVLRHEGPEFCPGALSHLAKLLSRPSVTLAEVSHLHLQVDLAMQHQALVEGELRYYLAKSANIALHFQPPLNGCSAILDLGCGAARTVDRDCISQSRFDAAAPGKSSPTVIDPAYELLLKRILDMVRIRERRAA